MVVKIEENSTEEYKTISEILQDLAIHSEKINLYLLQKKLYEKYFIKNQRKNINNLKSTGRDLFPDSLDATLQKLDLISKQSKEENLDLDQIFKKINDIKNEIELIKHNNEEEEKIQTTKNNIEEKRNIKIEQEEQNNKIKEKQNYKKIEEEINKNREKQEKEIIEKNREMQQKLEQEKSQKEKLRQEQEKLEQEKLKKEKSEQEQQKLQQEKFKQQEKDKNEKIKQNELIKKEKQEKEENKSQNIEDKNKQKDKDNVKKFLNDLGFKSDNLNDKNFVNKILEDREKIQNAKNILKENSIENIEIAKEKLNMLENAIMELQSIIESIISSRETVPTDLIDKLQDVISLKDNIANAVNIISSSGITM